MKKIITPACTAICLSVMTATSIAQLTQPNEEALSRLYSGKVYSPYAERNFPERPLWGDNHLHTSLSMDAGGFGNRLSPGEAYRFARGEEVISSTGGRRCHAGPDQDLLAGQDGQGDVRQLFPRLPALRHDLGPGDR